MPRFLTTCIVMFAAFASRGLIASFTISGSSVTPQTLGGSETGTVTSSGSLTVSTNNPSVTMSGGTGANPTTLINSGIIRQTRSGGGRAVQSSGTNAALVIQNNAGATISTANDDTVAAGTGSTTVTSVSLTNAGTIQSFAGGQAVNFNKITSGANSITNSGSILAANSDAVRPGVNGTVGNTGTIKSTTDNNSNVDGIAALTNSGVAITNSGSGLVEGARHGISGGNTTTGIYQISITNEASATIQGDNGSGINISGINGSELATIVNHGAITGSGLTGDGDGVDVDGLVNLTNTGTIRSLTSSASGTAPSEGVTIGGGTIINSGTIEGLVAPGNTSVVGRGLTVGGIDSGVTTAPIYGNTVITNSGLIRGQSDSGILVKGAASGFTVTITNQAGGTIKGGGAIAPAIQTGADADTIINSGSIIAESSGVAIDLGAGNDALQILAGAASITGDVSGGSGTNTATIDPDAGNSFSYSGTLSNFSTVKIKSGTTQLSGVSTYTGTTWITGGALVLQGPNRLSSASSLLLDGGALQFQSTTSGQTLSAFSLASSSAIDLNDTTSLTFASFGTYTPGAQLTITRHDETAGFALRFSGNYTANANFIAFSNAVTIDGFASRMSYSNGFTILAVPEPSTNCLAFALIAFTASRWRSKTRTVRCGVD